MKRPAKFDREVNCAIFYPGGQALQLSSNRTMLRDRESSSSTPRQWNFGSFAPWKVGIFRVRATFLNGKEASPYPLSRF
jgi:hypothetical protein